MRFFRIFLWSFLLNIALIGGEKGVYLGAAGGGAAHWDFYPYTNSSWQVFSGYRFHENLALEMGYAEFESDLTDLYFFPNLARETKGWRLSGVAFLPMRKDWPVLRNMALTTSLGVFRWETRASLRGRSGFFDALENGFEISSDALTATGTGLQASLGIRYALGHNLALQAAWETILDVAHHREEETANGSILIEQEPDIHNLTIGISYRF